jgi:hypothetical protein
MGIKLKKVDDEDTSPGTSPAGPKSSKEDSAQFGGPSADGKSWVNADPPSSMEIVEATAWKKRQKQAKADWERENGVLQLTFSQAKVKKAEEESAAAAAQYGEPNADGTAWVEKEPPADLDMMAKRQWLTAQREAKAAWEQTQ